MKNNFVQRPIEFRVWNSKNKKFIMQMDIEADDRWTRILKVVDEFKNVSLPFDKI